MTRFSLLIAIFALAACKPATESAETEPLEPVEGSSVPAEEPPTEPVAPDVVEEAEPPLDTAAALDTAEELAPPTLPSLMRQAGYDRASEASLADFVHVPPGAEGEAGVFGEGERAVRVAMIAYPNPRYVRPHVTDVQERIRVLPNPREAVLHHHRWVVHLMAVDKETADEAAERLREVLGW